MTFRPPSCDRKGIARRYSGKVDVSTKNRVAFDRCDDFLSAAAIFVHLPLASTGMNLQHADKATELYARANVSFYYPIENSSIEETSFNRSAS